MSPRPLWLFRRWKRAAGLFGSYVPAAPFTSLELHGLPVVPMRKRLNPLGLEQVCLTLAQHLQPTPQIEAVADGEAVLVLDLPAAMSVGLGYHLQALGINPVSLLGCLYRPTALIDGSASLAALITYGQKLKAATGNGYAFVLERERTGAAHVSDVTLLQTFDNRYRVSEFFFPPLEVLRAAGVSAFIDLRLEKDQLPIDLDMFYRYAAQNNFEVYQAFLPTAWTLEGMSA